MKYDSLVCGPDNFPDWGEVVVDLKPGSHIVTISRLLEHHKVAAAMEDCGVEIRDCVLFLGYPRYMVALGRLPLEGTVAQNVLQYGTGALNIDAGRISSEPRRMTQFKVKGSTGCFTTPGGITSHSGRDYKERVEIGGRWPANVILSGEPEINQRFPNSKGSPLEWRSTGARDGIAMNCSEDGSMRKAATYQGYGDDGSAARYFYNVPEDNKLQGLVAYLHKLITRPGGTTLVYGSYNGAIIHMRNQGFNIFSYHHD